MKNKKINWQGISVFWSSSYTVEVLRKLLKALLPYIYLL